MTKRCSKCGEIKEIDKFDKCSKVKNGHRNICKQCRHIKWQLEKAKYQEYWKQYYIANRGKIIKRSVDWRKNNIERAREKNKKWVNDNKEKVAISREKYMEKVGKDLLKERSYKSRSKKIELYRKRCREYQSRPEITAKCFFRQIGINNPPKELIDLKAMQIQLFRAVRDKRIGETL